MRPATPPESHVVTRPPETETDTIVSSPAPDGFAEIATDETEEYVAQELAKQRQDYADMICRIFRCFLRR